MKLLCDKCFAGLLAAGFLMAGCGAGKPAPSTNPAENPASKTTDSAAAAKTPVSAHKRIDLSRNVKIAVIPFIDGTELSKWEGWPQVEDSRRELVQYLEAINLNLANALRQASKLSRVKIVHQSQMPEFRIQLVFLKVVKSPGLITMPFEIRVYDQSAQKRDFSVSFKFSIKADLKRSKSMGLFFWKQLLGELKSGFPYDKIPENLFTSADGTF
jgi:hypothetical protein